MYVQLCPPVTPYIKKSFEGILMYELTGCYRENPKIGNYPSQTCPYVKQYTLVG
jgi:hypothetical protein